MAITMTETAAARAQKMIDGRGKPTTQGIRVGIKTSGCSGLSYVLEYVDDPQEGDAVFESFGVKVFVDPKSLLYIDGTEIDMEVGIMKSGFVFKNPNEKGACGCGESFAV
ncbi:MAG: iron-sulfur cluster assembly protein IscA [Alphaproteobacteria bacterium CG_4_10_14_0_2_um_filter_63_37]|nr:MAG: iron-sulfur cluster assembly protein IscA [Proteobacteria bacterium CG1_02_64_396]PJA25239.1 MAG: iron-sulfur cluster assembly protein IscA [Alphaproteobacteria bacterium CG_4_10_14_0_2_um_filter_63_37]